VTQTELRDTAPIASVNIAHEVSQFQACLFRWFDEGGWPSQIRFDDFLVFIPGSAVDLSFLVTTSGSAATMRTRTINPAKSLQVGAVEACAADSNAPVPAGYWNFSNLLSSL